MARRRECIWKTLREHTATSVELSPSSFGIQRVVNMIRIVKQVFASSADEMRGTMRGNGMKGCESHNEYVHTSGRTEPFRLSWGAGESGHGSVSATRCGFQNYFVASDRTKRYKVSNFNGLPTRTPHYASSP